ncbi:MAG: RNA polymerase subunit sigma-24 [Verrucomicrobia bacterium]|nr:MAG: RNA polymerase subunit sigma-24 [Verrucomicrobiota bacterium]
MSDVTHILQAVERGEENSATRLLPLVYEELRKLAAGKMAYESDTQTLQPTALVHEAWLRLTGSNQGQWQNRGHFFGAAAEAMRRILIERARRRARLKHGDGKQHLDIANLELSAESADERLLAVNEALDQLQTGDPKKARVVLLKFFGGLTNAEVAETLGVTERTVERLWAFAKVWLMRSMRQDF